MEKLGSKPYAFSSDLNESVAIDKPGRYTLKVVSKRIGQGTTYSSIRLSPIESNLLRFEVVKAEPQWEAQTIADAVSRIEASYTHKELKLKAARILRYLGTPAAVRASVVEMGRMTDGDIQWQLMAGLFGAPDRDVVVAELQRNIEDPDFAITRDFIDTLVLLQNPGPRSAYPTKGAAGEQKAWLGALGNHWAKNAATHTAAYTRAAALIPLKRGKAKSETVRTFLSLPENGNYLKAAIEMVKETDLAEAFLDWSKYDQEELLRTVNDRFLSPAMGDSIKKLVYGQGEDRLDHADALLRFQLLRTLLKIDPQAARQYIIGDILEPRSNWAWESDCFLLPDKTLPRVDTALGGRIGNPQNRFNDRDAQNIGRYATRAILPQVKAAYSTAVEPGSVCEFYGGLTSYLLKYDRKAGVARFEELSKKCWPDGLRPPMETATELGIWPQIEPILIARLGDAHPNMAADFARVLSERGTKKAHQALLARLRRLHDENVGQGGSHRADHPHPDFERVLIQALGDSPNWILSNEEVAEIQGLALAKSNKGIAAQYHWKSPVELFINGVGRKFSLNRKPIDKLESLMKRISNYPKGTGFSLRYPTQDPKSVELQRMFKEFAGKSGFVVKDESATASRN